MVQVLPKLLVKKAWTNHQFEPFTYEKREKTVHIGIRTAVYNIKIPMIRDKTDAKLEMEQLLSIWVEDCANRYSENYNSIIGKDYCAKNQNV